MPVQGKRRAAERKGFEQDLRVYGDRTMSLALQLRDWRLTTAEILYHMPDHPGLLQTYIWQEFDLAPAYPSLRKFLDFWNRELDGKLHSVRVGTAGVLRAADWRAPHMRVVQ
jgi:uncharacterized protein Usg